MKRMSLQRSGVSLFDLNLLLLTSTQLISDNFEKYRKSLRCPYEGCKSGTKLIKKLGNHLTSVHQITNAKERAKAMEQARKITIIPTAPGQQTLEDVAPSTSRDIEEPLLKENGRNTRHFPRYKASCKPLTDYLEYLISFDGGKRSNDDARNHVTVIAKYLAFKDKRTFSWKHAFDVDGLRDFVKAMESAGVKADGILGKLDSLIIAIRYVTRRVKITVDGVNPDDIMEQLRSWKGTFKTLKIKTTLQRAAKESIAEKSAADILDDVNNLLQSPEADTYFEHVLDKSSDVQDSELDIMAVRIFIALTYSNLQRAGAAINITIKEATDAQLVKGIDGSHLMRVLASTHKTAKTLGPACLYLKRDDIRIFQLYLEARKVKGNDDDIFLVRRGVSFQKHYTRYINDYRKMFNISAEVPSLTQFRKAGSLLAIETASHAEIEHISRQMGHSSTTAERYYRTQVAGEKSIQAYTSISNIMATTRAAPVTKTLLQYFSDDIEKSKTPSLINCRQYIRDCMIVDKADKQIQDKVRNHIKAQKKSSVPK